MSNEVLEEVIHSHSDQEKWRDIQYQFILLCHYLQHLPVMGPIENVYSQSLDKVSKINLDLIQHIRTEMEKRKIPLLSPPCYTYLLPYLSDNKIVDHPSIKKFIRETGRFLNISVDHEKSDYRNIRDGIYASMGLTYPDKLKE